MATDGLPGGPCAVVRERSRAASLLDALRQWADARSRRCTQGMIGHDARGIAHYLARNWLEIAGFVTTVLGIWLTTQPPADLLAGRAGRRRALPGRLLSGAAVFRCAAAGFLCRLHALRLVALVARRARRRRSARCSAARAQPADCGRLPGAAGSFVLGELAKRLHAALPYLDATLDQLQPCGELVAGAQAHRELVAVDRRGPDLYRRISLQRPVGTAVLYAGLVGLAVLGLRDWRRAVRPLQIAACTTFRSGSPAM